MNDELNKLETIIEDLKANKLARRGRPERDFDASVVEIQPACGRGIPFGEVALFPGEH